MKKSFVYTSVPSSRGLMAQSPLMKSIVSLGMVLAFLGAAGLILTVGIGESVTTITSPDEVNSDTNTTFGGSVGVPDRVVMIGAAVTLLGPAGLAVVNTQTGGPAVGRLIRLAPLALGFIGIIEFSDTVLDMVQGDYTWTGTQGEDMLAVFVTGATITGIAQAFGWKS